MSLLLQTEVQLQTVFCSSSKLFPSPICLPNKDGKQSKLFQTEKEAVQRLLQLSHLKKESELPKRSPSCSHLASPSVNVLPHALKVSSVAHPQLNCQELCHPRQDLRFPQGAETWHEEAIPGVMSILNATFCVGSTPHNNLAHVPLLGSLVFFPTYLFPTFFQNNLLHALPTSCFEVGGYKSQQSHWATKLSSPYSLTASPLQINQKDFDQMIWVANSELYNSRHQLRNYSTCVSNTGLPYTLQNCEWCGPARGCRGSLASLPSHPSYHTHPGIEPKAVCDRLMRPSL